jgi:hypothetical protein
VVPQRKTEQGGHLFDGRAYGGEAFQFVGVQLDGGLAGHEAPVSWVIGNFGSLVPA